MSTWGTLIAAAVALAGVIFTTGSASQRLDSYGTRITNVEADERSTALAVASLAAQMNDVQRTVHHVDGSPIPEGAKPRR